MPEGRLERTRLAYEDSRRRRAIADFRDTAHRYMSHKDRNVRNMAIAVAGVYADRDHGDETTK